jgi:hypothetical protein
MTAENRKTETSRRTNGDLLADAGTPSHQGSSGGSMATEIGSRDEERNALSGDPARTRPTKQDKVHP